LKVLTFASTNHNKFLEVRSILAVHGITVEFAQINLVEVQSDSIEEIATEKAKNALLQVGERVIVEDDGLFIDSLLGFPGQYSSYALKTIGIDGIIKLLAGSADRSASFRSLIAFHDGGRLHISDGHVDGRISEKITKGGWGYDPIFIPAGTNLTFAELKEKKSEYSHRKKALDNFARWYSTA
jgi:XTP/dITP diphosphohydrolase